MSQEVQEQRVLHCRARAEGGTRSGVHGGQQAEGGVPWHGGGVAALREREAAGARRLQQAGEPLQSLRRRQVYLRRREESRSDREYEFAS